MFTLQECCRPVFGRHETFHPRWGWFSKAVAEGKANPYVFQQADAPLRLGVGKNMVRAIRYWGEASTLLKEIKPPKERLSAASPTLRGDALLDPETGTDPYLELTGSLWLLHWWMLQPAPQSMVPLAWYAFNAFRPQEFNTSDLEQAFFEECLKGSSDWKPAQNTLTRDSSCFLRTYAITAASLIDDALDAPLRQLGLLHAVAGQKRRYRFQSPAWIAPQIVLYVCVDYLVNIQHSSSTVTLTRLLHEVNSPGRVLRLREEQMIAELSDSSLGPWIDLSESIGALQVVLKQDLEAIRWQSLASYFDCSEYQAKLLASGGDVPLYESSALIERVNELKQARSRSLHEKSLEASDPGASSDLLQRMALSAALVEAGIKV
ncbi:DUF4007 family protein [Synechococcus sp. CBW1107]|uniref:DUF4007 family protein n=1 Tax=Synechococcus sp. CBW1107 TaxID=2789857 RepID=UPI002AD4261A|nr:DUF4007 family protein [Synechococcus sp. CBW1107]CAK6695329.1 hypothetical protein ICNINCKA_01802 [Synechococcus sp. CBW1107]